jgi:LuxR family transcriptional regulator, maltose regulon positive regulatory protein
LAFYTGDRGAERAGRPHLLDGPRGWRWSYARLLGLSPELQRLRAEVATLHSHVQLRFKVDTGLGGAVGVSSLTTAELRLLPLLFTHLTFAEISERLYVSPHAVKTQAISVYRKLGASSRGQAVQRAQQLGLGG